MSAGASRGAPVGRALQLHGDRRRQARDRPGGNRVHDEPGPVGTALASWLGRSRSTWWARTSTPSTSTEFLPVHVAELSVRRQRRDGWWLLPRGDTSSRPTNYAYADRARRSRAPGPPGTRPAGSQQLSGDDRAEVPRQKQGGLHPTAPVGQGEGQPALAGADHARQPGLRPGLDRGLLRQPAEAGRSAPSARGTSSSASSSWWAASAWPRGGMTPSPRRLQPGAELPRPSW